MALRMRARSQEAKAERKEAILAAAAALFAAGDVSTISMAGVAARAGVAKGTPYLYFKTKEELFLALLERDLDDWFDALDAALGYGTGRLQATVLTDLFVSSLADRPALRRLLAVLGAVLEHNVEYDRALRFKSRLAGRISATGALLERRTVFLRPGDGARLLSHLHALTVGLALQADPAPVMRRILEAPGMEVLRVEFERELRAAVRALLTGLERTN
jgi:TetR/AcrR family transcriptional regulator